MSLEKYVKKRDFTKTKEPSSGKRQAEATLRFVVQRHHASHLHYDFRLEMDGVLKSWAIPKGPSLNPEDKRLAMMVEDHPYDYRTFEGTIPAGQYGGGTVHIFDEGTYQALDNGTEKDLRKGLHSGNLKFRLNGKILKGEFALVKMKNGEGNAWLLIKHKDKYAVAKKFNSEDLIAAAVKKEGLEFKKKEQSGKQHQVIDVEEDVAEEPAKKIGEITFKPMLAKLADVVFDDREWIYEKKLDGYRTIAYSNADGKVKLISRNGIDVTVKYKPVAEALSKLELEAVLDGELTVEDLKGKSYFQELQNYDVSNRKFVLRYHVFDLLALNGHDIRSMELIRRKELLKTLIVDLDSSIVVYSTHLEGQGKKLYAKAEKEGWEGIMAKHAHSTYLSGKRTDQWLKFKFNQAQEAVIIGYLKPQGSRAYFGSLALAMYEGTELVYIGNCGTGFNDQSLKQLYDLMQPLKIVHKPVQAKVHKEHEVTWIRPELVCEVTYSEWTADQHLRHPVFKGLRMDKQKKEVMKEETTTQPEGREETFGRIKVKLTNLNKLYWKKEGITKGELLKYYSQVSSHLLPHLKDKPLSLNRHPNGIDAPGFFQKDLDTDQIPSWIKYAPLYSESTDKEIDYLICNNPATLLWMVNLGCIEINPWLSTYQKPENPLFAVLDLDPHDLDFKEVVKVARTAKDILDTMKIKAFIKTSGSKGLHIFIPVGTGMDYDITKDFIHYLGQIILERHPETTSLERTPSKRKNKIYLDFLQNRKGQTIAAPYSVRPKPEATVSAPLDWEEVNDQLNLKDYTLFNMPARIEEKGDLWADIGKQKNNLVRGLKYWKASAT